MKKLALFLLLGTYAVAQTNDARLRMEAIKLRTGQKLQGCTIGRLPEDSTLIFFVPPFTFRLISSDQINDFSSHEADSSIARELQARLNYELADIRLRDSTILSHLFPLQTKGDSIRVVEDNGGLNWIPISSVSTVTIPRKKNPENFRTTGFLAGAGIGAVSGFFFGKTPIPFGSEEPSLKSTNQSLIGGLYNSFVWAVIGGVSGYVVGLSVDAASSKRVTFELEGLTEEERSELLGKIVSQYASLKRN